MFYTIFLFVLVAGPFIEKTYGYLQFNRPLQRTIIANIPHKLKPLPASTKTGDKIRVRLLQEIKGVGRKGEITMVSRAQFTNVLSPRKSAERVSDEEAKKIEAEMKQSLHVLMERAKEASKVILTLPVVRITRKIGPNQKLFGSVNVKNILDALESTMPSDVALDKKMISIVDVLECSSGEDGECAIDLGKSAEIRKAGTYKAVLQLHKSVEMVTFKFEIVSE
mmetsp:Transcript_21901/g.36666  ORF Transcript_21901/g.36666 Transcript_21901/m.36666 type:complete len:223 (+) Transcript_21901:93-761(+)|eukprot:CAMPEP_0174973302 /NCGR_PEP_ID=MMETSP0004_2-20121128/11159_1 /TAXON_ID=420556 /ORGANISM="Ochromonas sp., Strain CCMP1393" /LENGTH=222 /DNA_ID=CAMNT_0016223721 /DNA_START=85 /DNA_END=753 /DNA_ORIENTATION=-